MANKDIAFSCAKCYNAGRSVFLSNMLHGHDLKIETEDAIMRSIKRKLGGVFRRAGAGALALVLGASIGLSAAPPFTARAAGTGGLAVTLYDSETGATYGQGLARMEARDIQVYDVSRLDDRRLAVDANGDPVMEDDGAGGQRQKVEYASFTASDGSTHNFLSCYTARRDDNGQPHGYTLNCLEHHAKKIMVQMSSEHAGGKTVLRLLPRTGSFGDNQNLVSGTDGPSAGGAFIDTPDYVAIERSNGRMSAYGYEASEYDNTMDGFYHEWSGAQSDASLYNAPMRGGFSFRVTDVETGSRNGALQTMGMPTGSVFAVFNINGTAVAPDGYEDIAHLEMGADDRWPQYKAGAKPESELKSGKYGSVRVVTNMAPASNNNLSNACQAYDYDRVMDAYDAYLDASAKNAYTADHLDTVRYAGDGKIPYYNGMYGYAAGNADYTCDTNLRYGDLSSGLFDMNGVRPCAMLAADANGRVRTGPEAFPAGNYLVLQVKAPDGYYIDENFRMAVSIGPWYYSANQDVTSGGDLGDVGSGYGNALFNQIGYTLRDASRIATGEKFAGGAYVAAGFRQLDKYPAAYVGLGGEREISTETCQAYGVSKNAGVTGYTVRDNGNGITYTRNTGSVLDGMGNKGIYHINNDQVGTRRYPKDGDSRLEPHIAPVRSGVSFYLSDTDRANPGPQGPQGDGRLENAVFRLYHDRSDGNDANGAFVQNGGATGGREPVNRGFQSWIGLSGQDGSKRMTNNVSDSWRLNPNAGKEYKAVRQPDGRYLLNIPVDDLPYGEYTLVQVSGGDGYGISKTDLPWAAHEQEELAVGLIRVVGEDMVTVKWSGTLVGEDATKEQVDAATGKYTANGTTYLPNTIYRADGSVSVSVRGEASPDGVSAHIRVFNISEQPVYIGGVQKPTAKSAYDAGIANRDNISVANMAGYVSGQSWTDAMLWEGDIAAGQSQADNLKQLPYGTYLVAVTVVTGGTGQYSPMGGAAALLTVRPGVLPAVSVILADGARMPVVSTSLTDQSTGTRSAAVTAAGSFADKVMLENLQPDVNYVIYGMLVDRSTGEIAVGTGITSTKVSAYKPSGGTGTDTSATLASLLATGEAFKDDASLTGEGYVTWILTARDYVKSLPQNNASKAELSRMVEALYAANPRKITAHNTIMGTLRYLYNNTGDAGLSGADEASLTYTNIDTRPLQGKTLAAYVFVCEQTQPDSFVLQSKTVEEAKTAMGASLAAEHASLMNTDQTAYVPGMSITASGPAGTKRMDPGGTVSVSVSGTGLEPGGDYRLVADLRDEKGNVLKTKDGKDVVLEQLFTASGDGYSHGFDFNTMDPGTLNGKRITAYAALYRRVTAGNAVQDHLLLQKGDSQSMGWKPDDAEPGANQVDVAGSTVKTVLTDQNGNKTADLKASRVRLRDRVTYTDLTPGEKYESVLSLKYPNGSDVLGADGKAVTSTYGFTARTAGSLSVQVDVSFDGRGLTDKSVVAFNDLYHVTDAGRVLVVSEHDPESDSQTVTDQATQGRYYFQTEALDDASQTHYTQLGTAVPVTDSVRIQGLDPDGSYELRTVAANARTGDKIPNFVEKKTAVKANASGVITADVKLQLNTVPVQGQKIVVYEYLYDSSGMELVAEHADPDDLEQTLYVPGIDTFATGTDGQSKTVMPEKKENHDITVTANPDGTLKTDDKVTYAYEAVIRDRIDYKHLVPGGQYTITTQVVAAGGGAKISETVTKFSTMDASGSVTVDITADVSKHMNKDVVVYESIVDDATKKTVLQHQDALDPDQTVKIGLPDGVADPDAAPGQDGTNGPGGNLVQGNGQGGKIQTGVDERFGLYFGLAALFAAVSLAAGGYAAYRRKRTEK